MVSLKKIINDGDLVLAYSCKISAPFCEIMSRKDYELFSNQIKKWHFIKSKIKSFKAKKIVSETIRHTANQLSKYEKSKYKIEKLKPSQILKSFMDDHDLSQKDLSIYFGSQSIVSEVLNNKRNISLEAAKKLGKRFAVSPILFLDI